MPAEAKYAMLPGPRASRKRLSPGLGVKVPVWTDLNEENEQQGGEGTEDYRFRGGDGRNEFFNGLLKG